MDQRRLSKVVAKSLQVERFDRSAEVSVVLTDDEHIRRLNRDYRGVDYPTDVLAFSQLEGEPARAAEAPVALGDVIISVETAKRQAAQRKYPVTEELDLLVIHGVLHLLGYDDETEAAAAEMRRHEKAVLSQLENGRTSEKRQRT